MTNEEAYSVLNRLTGFYNKNLSEEQTLTWIEELESLNELASRKVLKELKTNNVHASSIPSIPEFIRLHKTFVEEREDDNYFCYVCENRGMEWVRRYEVQGDVTYEYDIAVHCDCCEKGKQNAVDFTNKQGVRYYSEPISKYCDVNEKMRINKQKRVAQQEKNKATKASVHKKIFYELMSDIREKRCLV